MHKKPKKKEENIIKATCQIYILIEIARNKLRRKTNLTQTYTLNNCLLDSDCCSHAVDYMYSFSLYFFALSLSVKYLCQYNSKIESIDP